MTVPSWKTEFAQVTPRIYSYIQAGGPGLPNFNLSNGSAIVGDEAVMVVDTLQGPIPAKAFLQQIRKVTAKPIRHIVNTHGHPDHTLGNQFFLPAEIIANEKSLEQALLIARASANEKTWKAQAGLAEGGEPRIFTPASLVIPAGVATVYYGTLKIELHVFEYAHSPGDIMVYVPQERVLLAGDCCFFYVAPTILTGTLAGSLKALDWIESLDVDVIVPGHGPVGTMKEVKLMRRYLETLGSEVRKRFDAGLSVTDAAASIDMGEFKEWSEAQDRLFRNTLRIYYELRGKPFTPVSLAEANEQMAEYLKKVRK